MQVCTNITLYSTAYLFCLELIFTSCSFLLQFCVLCTDKITKVISRYFRKTIHIFLNIDSTNTRYGYASKWQKNVVQIFIKTRRSCNALKMIYQRVSSTLVKKWRIMAWWNAQSIIYFTYIYYKQVGIILCNFHLYFGENIWAK